ncbi:MAG: hypothetical protein ACFBSF_08195 [Leptolyngbyaceae cyanobacterium]
MSVALDVFAQCVEAVQQGELIESVSSKDKEFHFQNWFQKRLEALGVFFDASGRNTYPDFRMVNSPDGFEVKGLAWPGRERDYDCNSQVPSGFHNGRQIFYVFGRYPADLSQYPAQAGGQRYYPVIDLVICHGDFLNADHDYIHKNKSVKGFGSYGDLMIRDRKMYVAPTPFALTEGTTGLMTLILPDNMEIGERFQQVGILLRVEASELVVGYTFDLRTNHLIAEKISNPTAGSKHQFKAYRLTSQTSRPVTMATGLTREENVLGDDE